MRETETDNVLARIARFLALTVLIGSALVLLVLAVTGSGIVELGEGQAGVAPVEARRRLWPWAALLLVASVAVAYLWWRDRRAGSVSLDRVTRSRRAGAAIQRKLRDEVHDLRSKTASWSSDDDVSNLILSLALELLGAEKGAIFESRSRAGERVLTSAVGFDADPRESAIVNRFATEALKRDEIVYEESPESGEARADDEIHNVVAIPIFLRDELNGVVVCADVEDPGSFDEDVLLALGDQAGAVLQNGQLHTEMRDAHIETVRMLVEAIRAKDPHLGGHSEEVSVYVSRVADDLGFDSARRERLLFASLLHDIGKIGISERILLKPGRLSPEEFAMIELHPTIGSRLVARVPSLSELSDPILHHHERFDGTGYPAGLAGEQIPLESRVIGVADAFSAMTSDRPYRGRLSLSAACEELERCAGTQFDPRVVEAFVSEVRDSPATAPSEAGPLVADVGPVGPEPAMIGDPLELTDSLTLLYTHRYFHEHVAALAARTDTSGGFAIIRIEVGSLPAINRADGYAAGDRALQVAARAIEDVAVGNGGTAARYGGRTFALAIEGPGAAVAQAAAADIISTAPEALGLVTSAALWQPGMSADAVVAAAAGVLPEPGDLADPSPPQR